MKNIHHKFKVVLNSFLLVSTVAFASTLHADDTEVFYSVNVSKPNLLFVLDLSGSMAEPVEVGDDSEAKTFKYTVDKEISSWWDDGYQRLNRRTPVLDSWAIRMNRGTLAAVSFSNLGIPQGATITNAYVQFTASRTLSNKAKMRVFVEDTNNADAYWYNNFQYPNASTIRSNSRTNYAPVEWTLLPWQRGRKGLNERTPDLSEQIQKIVNKTNWELDNKISIRIVTDNGWRRAKSYDWGGSNPSDPLIHIEYETTEQVTKSRLDIMKSAFRRVLKEAPTNVNVGLMKYSSANYSVYIDESGTQEWIADDDYDHLTSNVGGVSFPITDINGFAASVTKGFDSRDNLVDPTDRITTRDYLADIVDSWGAYGSTPIVSSLFEAALYFRGEKMVYGKNKNNTEKIVQPIYYREQNIWYRDFVTESPGSHPSTYEGGKEIDNNIITEGRSSIDDAKYISPIKSTCQSNYLVLMSDGEPSGNTQIAKAVDGDLDYDPISKSTLISEFKASLTDGCADVTGLSDGVCGPELTKFLANEDQSPLKDKQTIQSFSIGFGSGLTPDGRSYLQSLATYQGKSPNYYDATDEATLASAFRTILAEISEPAGTLASPGYSVNIKNGMAHEKEIYIPVFDRKNSSVWTGNLKKFQLEDTGTKRLIQGSNGKNAVDELGGFTANAHDLWSNSPVADGPDGKDILKGGVASLLDDPDGRLAISDLTSNQELTAPANLLVPTNNHITNNLLGLPTTADLNARKKLIHFVRGWKGGDPDGEPSKHMGDMLHSEPLVITYKQASGGKAKEQYLFAATNEGYLHAFNTETGKEVFAFMPKELLKNIDPQFREAGTAKDHKYGVDGSISYWKKGDRTYIYFGFRRGGRSYYALDVSNIKKPKLLWKVTGSSDSANPLYTLGQSWSKPYLARVGMSDGTKKEVVIVSGGYDEAEDRDDSEASHEVTAKMGNDVFILDAKDGSLIWSLRNNMKNTEITNSIPGGLRVLDTNQNGSADRIYFADTGGNIWRLDLSESLGSNGVQDTKSSLVKLAELAGSDDQARMFYNEVDVSILKPTSKTIFAVSIGSGFRAHPLNKTIEDRFFVIYDQSPYNPLVTSGANKYETLTMDDLAEVKVDATGSSLSLSYEGFDTDKRKNGWSIKPPVKGEKILSDAVTMNGKVMFSTLVPEPLTAGTGVDPCAAPSSYGRLYALDILKGGAVLDLDKNNNTTDPDKNETVVINDDDIVSQPISKVIPGRVRLIFNEPKLKKEKDANGKVVKTTCEHAIDYRVGKKLSQVSGSDACKLESLYWNDPEK